MRQRKVITQIGSLPYADARQAVRCSLRHDIPFLPELPLLGEAMLEYIKDPGHLSCLEEFKRRRFDIAKIQCVGPATLVMAGYSEDEAVSRVYEHVSGIVSGLKAREIILFLDEPALGQAGFDFQALWEPILASFDVVPGVHCCGNMDWDVLFQSPLIGIISFDASRYDITKYPFYRGGKRIAWGVESREDVKDFQPGDLLTLPCGMSPVKYSVEDCDRELRKLRRIAKKLNP